MNSSKASGSLKHLPVGISDYREAVTRYYCVDKTLLIRDIIDKGAKVMLITRPGRFGKTLNMSMIRTFFEETGEDKSVYFRDTKIWQCGAKYTEQMGTCPVIHISLKDAGGRTWEECCFEICTVITKEYNRWIEIADSPRLTPYERKAFNAIADMSAGEDTYRASLLTLSELVMKCYGKKSVLLIDEYDAPIRAGYLHGYEDKVTDFMDPLLAKALKDNCNMKFAVLTGILRVSKGNIFGGLNNLKTYSVLDDTFSEYYGFTREETKELLDYYGHGDMYENALNWYGGYRFGSTKIFNPWSVINYVDDGAPAMAQNYWRGVSGEEVIISILKSATPEILNNLIALLQGGTVVAAIDRNLSYTELKGNPANVYTLLLMSGYLRAADVQRSSIPGDSSGEMHRDSPGNIPGDIPVDNHGKAMRDMFNRHRYSLAVPNREVREALYYIIQRVTGERSG